jgi:multiple sugar transport system permease protein
VIVTVVTVILSILLICSLAALFLRLSQLEGPRPDPLVMLATLIMPFETIAIPLLLIVSQLPWIGFEGFEIGWLNTYRVQIIPWIADGLTIFLFVQYFKDLPRN